jgi:hypothetical protein
VAVARSALHRVQQALPRARHGFARLARCLVVERLTRRIEVRLRALQFLAQRLRHANVLRLVALQLPLHLLALPLRVALGGLALLFGLALRGFVLPFRLAHRLLVLAQRLFVLTQRSLVLLLGLTLGLLVLQLRLAHRLFLLQHRLAVSLLVLALCLFVLQLRLAHGLFVLLHGLAVRLLVLALLQLVLVLAFARLLDVLALARRLRLGQRLAQLLHLAFGLRELVLGCFDARGSAFDQLDGVLWDGLGSGDDGGEDTQGAADKSAGEHEDLRGERAAA